MHFTPLHHFLLLLLAATFFNGVLANKGSNPGPTCGAPFCARAAVTAALEKKAAMLQKKSQGDSEAARVLAAMYGE